MKFELTVTPKTLHQDNKIVSLDTHLELRINRNEIIRCFEEDEMNYYITLREMVYAFHHPRGYVSLLTDEAMYSVYDYLKNNEEANCIIFDLTEREDISEDENKLMKRGHKVDMFIRWN